MCGICGFVSKIGGIPSGVIEKMLAPMEHRGPDDKGVFYDTARGPACALGHRRLSIIDLETGHQPLSDEAGDNICVHNGEIYNFNELKESLKREGCRFKTSSDTEVIANMYRKYGNACGEHLNGMFAFAVWNQKDRSLFLCRDRAGIKPLYYFYNGKEFVFSSSLKSFFPLDFVAKEIDFESLSAYLQYLYINAPKTIFKSIRKLEPGNYLYLKDGHITIEKYWDMTDIVSGSDGKFIYDEAECINGIRGLLEKSVKARLMSDVPLGVFLSGGVDSSIITALAARQSTSRLRTFSVSFRGKGYHDESAFAKRVSDLFGTQHSEMEISPDLETELSAIVDFLDEPFADSSFIPTYYLSKFTRQHVKVALSGTGGDDIFAGYRRYALDQAIEMFEKSPGLVKKVFLFAVNNMVPGRHSRLGEKALLGRRFCSALNAEKGNRHNTIMSFITREMQEELLEPGFRSTNNAEAVNEISRAFDSGHPINKPLYTDFLSYLAGDLLTKEDRATMAVGLEGRVPFLDHNLIEYSFRIKPEFKLKGFSTKYILKKAFRDILPNDILYREKHGFSFPISELIRTTLKSVTQDILFSGGHGLFKRSALEEIFTRHLEGKEDFGQHLWALIVFNLWYEKNMR